MKTTKSLLISLAALLIMTATSCSKSNDVKPKKPSADPIRTRTSPQTID